MVKVINRIQGAIREHEMLKGFPAGDADAARSGQLIRLGPSFPSVTRQTLLSHLSDHACAATFFDKPERSMLRTLPDSGRALFTLFENIVYKPTYDGTLKTGIKNTKSAA